MSVRILIYHEAFLAREVLIHMGYRDEVIEKIAALLTAAFGLVAALAWNGAIQALFKQYFGDAENLTAMILYAVIVTIIAVVITIWIGRIAAKAKSEEKKE